MHIRFSFYRSFLNDFIFTAKNFILPLLLKLLVIIEQIVKNNKEKHNAYLGVKIPQFV